MAREALGLLRDDPKAVDFAEKALQDRQPEVEAAMLQATYIL